MTATLTLFPLLGRTPPPWRWPADVLATSFGTHVAYVTGVAMVDNALGGGDARARVPERHPRRRSPTSPRPNASNVRSRSAPVERVGRPQRPGMSSSSR
jgi:hypothetical protein